MTSESAPTLRPVEDRDVAGVLRLIAEVYGEYGLTLRAEWEEPHLLAPGPHFRARGGECWALERCGDIVGTCGVRIDRGCAELKALYLHPTLRGQGWGERLVGQVVAFARRAGCGEVLLWSDTRFLHAHRLYERLGFVRGGVRHLRDSNYSVEYQYTLDLACGAAAAFDAAAWARRLGGEGCALCPELARPVEGDPACVAVLASGRVRLEDDAAFLGYCVLVFRRHAAELHELSRDERAALLDDKVRLSAAVLAVCRPAKLNYAILGNQQPHLHVHVIPRYPDDGYWGRSPWARPEGERRPLPAGEFTALRAALAERLLGS